MPTKIIFEDRIVQFPNRFMLTDLGGGLYDVQASGGTVTQAGTPLSSTNLNALGDEVVFYTEDTSTSQTGYSGNIVGLLSYYKGLKVMFVPVNSSSGASTISISGLGLKNIKKVNSESGKVNIGKDDLLGGKAAILVYDGADFQLTDPAGDLTELQTTVTTLQTTVNDLSTAVNQITNDSLKMVSVGGPANAYTATIAGVNSLPAGLKLMLLLDIDNTGASTLKINSIAAKNIYFNGAALAGGELKNGQIAIVAYDGVQFQLQPTAKQIGDLNASVTAVNNTVTSHLADSTYQLATGTATAIIINTATLVDGYSKNFIVSANNAGAVTTINGKKLYKPNTTISPNLTAGKAVTVWYSATGDSGNGCFFIKASAEGNATTGDVLAGKTFSSDIDTGLVGTMDLSNLIADNIRKDVTINGVTGSNLKYGLNDTLDITKYSVSVPTGTKLWDNINTGSANGCVAVCKSLNSNYVYVAYANSGGKTLRKLNISDGSEIWGITTVSNISDIIVDNNDDIYIACSNTTGAKGVIKISGVTGVEIWSSTAVITTADIEVDNNGYVYVSNYLATGLKTLRKLNATTGAEIWNNTTCPYASGIAFDSINNCLYVTCYSTTSGTLKKINITSGAEIWSKPYTYINNVCVDNLGDVYIQRTLADNSVLKISAIDGTSIWGLAVNYPSKISADNHGSLFVTCNGIYKIHTDTGKIVYSDTANSSIYVFCDSIGNIYTTYGFATPSVSTLRKHVGSDTIKITS